MSGVQQNYQAGPPPFLEAVVPGWFGREWENKLPKRVRPMPQNKLRMAYSIMSLYFQIGPKENRGNQLSEKKRQKAQSGSSHQRTQGQYGLMDLEIWTNWRGS